MLKGSCIRSKTVFLRIELSWLGEPRLRREQRFSAAVILDGICTLRLESYSTDGLTNTLKIVRKHNTSPLTSHRV